MKGLFYSLENLLNREKAFELPYEVLESKFEKSEIENMKKLGVFILRGYKYLIVIHIKDPKKLENEFGGFEGLKFEMTQFVNKLAGSPLTNASDVVVYDHVHRQFLNNLREWAKDSSNISEEKIDNFAKHQFPLSDFLSFFNQK